MSGTVILVLMAALLGQNCRGENMSQRPKVEQVVATAKQTATLPCSTSENSEVLGVEWSKEGPQRSIIFFYMNGCEHLDVKNETFEGRTSIIVKELKKGNFSLLISNVQLTDAGTYQCMVKQKEVKILSVVNLIMVSDPVLSVVPAEDDRASLQCEVDYCSMEPDIKILDHAENPIKAETSMKHRDSRGCITRKITVTLQSPTKRVICRVHHPEINVTKETVFNLPGGCMKSCLATAVYVGVVVPALIVLVVIVWTKYKMTEKLSKLFTPSSAEDNAENDAIEQKVTGTKVPVETEDGKRILDVSRQGQSTTDKTEQKSTKPTDPCYGSSSKVCNTSQDNNLRQDTTANSSPPKSSSSPPKASRSGQAACSTNEPKGRHPSISSLRMTLAPPRCPSISLSNNSADLLETEQLLEDREDDMYSSGEK